MSSVSPYQEFSQKGEFFQTLVHLYTAYSLEHKPSPLRHQNINFEVHPILCLTTEKEPILTSESCTHQEKVVIWPKGGPGGWAKGKSLQVVIMKAKANVEGARLDPLYSMFQCSVQLNTPLLSPITTGFIVLLQKDSRKPQSYGTCRGEEKKTAD